MENTMFFIYRDKQKYTKNTKNQNLYMGQKLLIVDDESSHSNAH